MLDTGANAISAPTEMYRFMARTARKGRLEIDLTDKDGTPASLSFEYDMDDRYNAQVLDSGGGETDHRVHFYDWHGDRSARRPWPEPTSAWTTESEKCAT